MPALIALFLIVLLYGEVNGQETWTLQQCIEHALNNNLTVKQQDLNIAYYRQQQKQNVASLFPSLNSSVSQGFNYGRSLDPTSYEFVQQKIRTSSISMSSSMTLFSGLQKINTIKKGNLDYEASRADAENTRNTIALNVTTAYLNILLAKEEIDIAQAQIENTREQLSRTQKLVEAGARPEGDLLEMEAQLSRDEIALITARNAHDLAIVAMINLLDLNPELPFDIEVPEINLPDEAEFESINPEQVFQEALNSQPSIASASLKMSSAEKSYQIARGNHSPRITLNAGVNTNYSSARQEVDQQFFFYPEIGYLESDSTPVISNTPFAITTFKKTPFGKQLDENLSEYISINLNIPIFNGFQTRTAIQQAKIQMLQARYNYEIAQDNLRDAVYRAYADARAAAAQYYAALKNIESQRKSFEYTRQKFEAGMASPFDFSTAKTFLAQAEANLSKAKYDYLFKLKILDYYRGKPLSLD